MQTGEEEEDTLFQVRGKLYALSDQNAWKERGTGLLKINVRKSDGGGARLGATSICDLVKNHLPTLLKFISYAQRSGLYAPPKCPPL